MLGQDADKRRKRDWHMRGTTVVAADLIASFSGDSFRKDGRKISVGDCALFKPPQDSPPFIGIIRSVTLSKENNLHLGVNWLYRPAEVKLGKGILVDAKPNEIFYSFHKDEIPAALLLHPCKVAFLPKGVELSPGISSFVCRRVYDIAHKCLWWLTDQDYTNERQEEVDQLLHKTQIEMHASVQPGGRSPKQVSGSTSTSQLKTGSDNIQITPTSFPTQVKGKKRERAEQGSEPVKREWSSKIDDSDPDQNMLKSEIAKITEKGGLIDFEGVEKLVQLMLAERMERKMDLMIRSMLAGVVATTDSFDCLNQFVLLKGVPVFDEWLQDIHKGKIGDGSSPKDGDKAIEEFLFVLLRALDKLPVNLHALQMCNIGRSVNQLRSHKNLEIQRKARGLVDTWKKRVEAEMNVIDSKSGSNHASSWSSKSRVSEVSHAGGRHPVGSSEVVMKSSFTQVSASKIASAKPVQGESVIKSASSSPAHTKSAQSPVSGKDSQPRISVSSASELPSTIAREEKSSSSSQSHNNSQSFSGKEEARSSTVGSMSVGKISSGSRHRKSISGFPGMAVSGGQRETGPSRNSSLNRNATTERLSQSALTCEKAVDVPIVDSNNHKLIVKIPNRVRSPAQSASGGSFEDPSTINSRASSPVLSEKHDQFDRNLKERCEGHQANLTSDVNESWQSNDLKDVLTGSDEGDGSPATVVDEEQCRTIEECRKVPDIVNAASSSSGNTRKSEKLQGICYNSMNALIESCAKYSEANAVMSPGDDVGMNLLATVAAGEMSKSDVVSPTNSPQRNNPITEEACRGDDVRSEAAPDGNIAEGGIQINSDAKGDHEKQGIIASRSFHRDQKMKFSSSEEVPVQNNRQMTGEPCYGTDEGIYEKKACVSALHPNVTCTKKDVKESKLGEEKATADGILETKPKVIQWSKVEKVNDVHSTTEDGKSIADVSPKSLSEAEERNKENVKEQFKTGIRMDHKLDATGVNSGHAEKSVERMAHLADKNSLMLHNVSKSKVEDGDEKDICSRTKEAKRWKPNERSEEHSAIEHGMGVNTEFKVMLQVLPKHHSEVVPEKGSSSLSVQEVNENAVMRESKMTSIRVEGREGHALPAAEVSSSSAPRSVATDSNLKFDLNEGFSVDDGKSGESINLVAPGHPSSVNLINPLPFTFSSISSHLPPSITVAAAAKGPFVPPDDLLRSKGELGWRGSAATSAFRPAEPRKVMDIPLASTSSSIHDDTAIRNGRFPLDIDLNVPDERVLEEMADQETDVKMCFKSELIHNHGLVRNEPLGSVRVASSGGFSLDLNQVDEANEIVQQAATTSRRVETTLLPIKSSQMGSIPNSEVRRDFDLNDGPTLDDTSVEPLSLVSQSRNSMLPQPITNLRISNPVIGNFSSWFPSNYSTVTVPSILPNRGDQFFPLAEPGAPQRLPGPTNGSTPFTPDIYRGSVLSSAPALSFPSAPFQYSVFPFGTTFPLPSTSYSGGSTAYVESSSTGRVCFPMVHSHPHGLAGAVSSQSTRPSVGIIPDGNIHGVMESGKGVRQGLDLNAGPGVVDLEGREESSSLALRQMAIAEEQARMFQLAGSVSKRKDPDGGWDEESFRYKQPSRH